MAYQFMRENRGQYAIRKMAGLLGVSSGSYYKWSRKWPSQRRDAADAELIRLIREIQTRHFRRYGKPAGTGRIAQ